MSVTEDIQKGRENYQRRQSMRSKSVQRRTQNKVLVEVGSFTEFILSKFRRKEMGVATPAKVALTERTRPYIQVIGNDLNSLLKWICSFFPKREKRYDHLEASWKRGRFGSN